MPISMKRPDGVFIYSPPSYFHGYFRIDQLPAKTSYTGAVTVPADGNTHRRVEVYYHVADDGLLLEDGNYRYLTFVPFSLFPPEGIDLTVSYNWRVTIKKV